MAFAAAAGRMDAGARQAMGEEMARRRGVDIAALRVGLEPPPERD